MFLVTFVLKFLRTSMEYFDGDDISEGKLATLRSFSASMLTTYVTLCLKTTLLRMNLISLTQ